MSNRLARVLWILTAVVATGCPCPETECPASPTFPPPSPPPGPTVILKQVPGHVIWQKHTPSGILDMTKGSTIFDSLDSACGCCLLRRDFIGIATMSLEFLPQSGGGGPADMILLKNNTAGSNVELSIHQTPGGLIWHIADLVSSKSCYLFPTDVIGDPLQVPEEFFDLTVLTDGTNQGTSATFQVRVPFQSEMP